jgi:hypothetical protein
MASTNLGSLTLNLIADVGQYTAPLDKAERQTKKAMQEMARAAKQLDNQYNSLAKNLEKEIALYGEVTRAAQLRYEVEKGALKNLTEEQKKNLSDMASKLDALDAANNNVTGSMRGFRGVATGLGYQLQDIAVQAQMGTNAFMILGQQGSQIASLFGPTGAIVGAVIAVGGAIAGALIPSLLKSGDTAEDVADKVSTLVAELNDLDEVQRKLVLTANEFTIEDQTKAYDEQGKKIAEIREEIARLNEENGKLQYVPAGSGGVLTGSGTGMMVFVDNTLKLRDATRQLNAAEVARVATLKEIEDLQDPTGGAQEIVNLNKELELLGLTGRALHEKTADQKGYTEGLKEEYVALSLLIDQREEEAELAKKAAKDAEDAAKKAAEQERARADNIEKLIKAMEREADLFGVTSRVAQTEYDILKKTIEVQGGLEGIEARRLLRGAERLDQLEAEKRLNDVFNIEIDARVKAQTDAAEDVKKAQEKALKDVQHQYEQFFERIDKVGADVWTGLLEGSTSVFDSIKKLFISTLAEMAHAAITRPIILQLQQQFMPVAGGAAQGGAGAAGGGGSAAGALGAVGGIYAAVAVAVVAGVNVWNKAQEEKFKELTAEFRQGTQSTGTLLGLANAKSDSLNNAIESLNKYADDTLSVNESMLRTLMDIRTGIAGVAAGFARQLDVAGGVPVSGIQTGTDFMQVGNLFTGEDPLNLKNSFGNAISELFEFGDNFTNAIMNKVSKELYSKKKKVIDSGIEIVGGSLADILATGTIDAFAYANVQTKKKVLGVTTSTKVKTQTAELSDILLTQFASVFEGAGEALNQSAQAFNLDFNNYVSQFLIDSTKLSLKGLEGDELTKEIESFFSSTLDKWAGVLVSGSDILEKFQQVGEGAFETVTRLASELNTFNQYADALNLNFNLTGFAAVEASQAIAEAAGGFDKLASSLSTYYENFFTAEERAAKEMESLTAIFNQLGIQQVPQTREQFRALIESLDLTDAKNQELFASLIGLSGAFSDLVPETEDVKVTVEDLTKQFAEFNRYVELLDLNFGRMGIATDVLAKSIADVAGGFDVINAAFQSYYENFFTVQEKAAKDMEAVNRVFADLGINTIPQTREQFRALVESLDLTNPENHKALVGLMSIQDEMASVFDYLADQAEEAARKAEEAAREAERLAEEAARKAEEAARAIRQKIGDAFSALGESISAERKKIEAANSATMQTLNASLTKNKQLMSALTGVLDSMALDAPQYEEITRRQAQAQIISANAISRAGGPLPDLSALENALGVLSKSDTGMFATFEDYARDFYITQNALKELESAAGKQVSADEQAIINQEKYFQNEMTRLDKILEYYQEQIDALDGIDRNVLSVAEAIYELNAALTGNAPNPSGQSMALLAATNVGSPSVTKLTSENYGSMTAPSIEKSFSDMLSELRGLREDLSISQYHIAKNTQQSNTLLQRWETDGLPPERAEL